MSVISQPPTVSVDMQSSRGELLGVSPAWRNWLTAVYNICSALTMSGTTAQRPTTLLWVGRMYFDTSLGIPVWVQSLGPTVWCDATGAPV